MSTPSEAERAINDLNGKTILDRKVSVQLARKPEPAQPAAAAAEGAEGEEGSARRRPSTRGRGRGRGGRAARGGRGAKKGEEEAAANGTTTNGQAPLSTTTNEAATTGEAGADAKGAARQRKQRGPPEDGVPSKTKIMVANLPYDLGEEKVSILRLKIEIRSTDPLYFSFLKSSRITPLPPPRSPSVLSPSSWSASCRLATSPAKVVASAS